MPPSVQEDTCYAYKHEPKFQEVPNITLKEIRDAIPKHYFEPSTFWGFYYVIRDLIQVVITYYVMIFHVEPYMAKVLKTNAVRQYSYGYNAGEWAVKFVVWNIFWWFQGVNLTGLWVMAHECGHRAFSSSEFLNDCMGLFLHSALLVPYHAWRITHGTHHKNTNHIDLDAVFIPIKKEKKTAKPLTNWSQQEPVNEPHIVSVFWALMMFTMGWPGHLLWNASGQKHNRRTNHFEPNSPLFRPRDRFNILLSDFSLVVVIGGLYYFGAYIATPMHLACYYFVPYLWGNFWLVFITYLHHSDRRLPHYNAENWNFVRGALCTVDRNYGWYLNWALHHINDSHAVHHLFSGMPHHNAIEVTRKYMRPILGKHYLTDDRWLIVQIWESWRYCKWVVPDEGVTYFRGAE